MHSSDNNAITVSYGSFSVTLSGHDKPFKLLKQVTDYYSLVAQKNPSFGAVPTAPPVELTVETVSASKPIITRQHTENKQEKFKEKQEEIEEKLVLEPVNTDNLWQEPIPPYSQSPLVLDEPIVQEMSAEDTLIAAADQPLTAPELPIEINARRARPKSQFLTSNYPFRHFPLRSPGRG
jgi:hypothetical protein